jgi:hypothetical protein
MALKVSEAFFFLVNFGTLLVLCSVDWFGASPFRLVAATVHKSIVAHLALFPDWAVLDLHFLPIKVL